jgi:hypothetical protein
MEAADADHAVEANNASDANNAGPDESGCDADGIMWEVERFANSLGTTAKFANACGIVIAVERTRRDIWLIFCPECRATADEAGEFFQGMAGLQNHVLERHPDTDVGRNVQVFNAKAVRYIQDHCRLYERLLYAHRLRDILENSELKNMLATKGQGAGRMTRAVRYHQQAVTKMIDGPDGKANFNPDIVHFIEPIDGKSRFDCTPDVAPRWSRLSVVSTVVKTSVDDSANWSSLSCARCGKNCTADGSKYFDGVYGLIKHAESHGVQKPTSDKDWGRFVNEHCHAFGVDPRLVSEADIPRVPAARVKA